MKCSNCGSENLEGALFCSSCGAKLDAASEAGVGEESINQIPNPKPKFDSKKIWIIVAIVAVLAAIIALIVATGSHKKTNNLTTAPGGTLTLSAPSTASVRSTAPPTTTDTTTAAPSINVEEVLGQLQKTEYLMLGEHGTSNYAVIIKNNSPYCLNISGTATFYDDSNNPIGTGTFTTVAVPAGSEVLHWYSTNGSAARADLKLVPSEAEPSKAVMQNLIIENSEHSDDEIVFTLKNNGNIPINEPRVNVAFILNGQLIGIGTSYGNNLAPGASGNLSVSLPGGGNYYDAALYFPYGEA